MVTIMDNDPSTKLYMNFFPPRSGDEDPDKVWLTNILKSRMIPFYRRNRVCIISAMVGAMLRMPIVDAYVDASLAHFDISPDLQWRWPCRNIRYTHTTRTWTAVGVAFLTIDDPRKTATIMMKSIIALLPDWPGSQLRLCWMSIPASSIRITDDNIVAPESFETKTRELHGQISLSLAYRCASSNRPYAGQRQSSTEYHELPEPARRR